MYIIHDTPCQVTKRMHAPISPHPHKPTSVCIFVLNIYMDINKYLAYIRIYTYIKARTLLLIPAPYLYILYTHAHTHAHARAHPQKKKTHTHTHTHPPTHTCGN
jgi:hypothetical protein